MEHTKSIGSRAEAAILAQLVKYYQSVSIPWGENHRYDFVVDDGICLQRIQAKTGRLISGVVRFNSCSTTLHHANGSRQHYRGDADLFAVYCEKLNKVYLIPVSKVGTTQVFLRIDPAKNGQSSKVHWAKDFEIQALLSVIG